MKHEEPVFHKIVSEEVIHYGKLLIPEDFATEHFSSVPISTNVILTVRGGRTWEIELSKSNGQMWLQNGWEKFAQDLSLKLGYSLVFIYEGACRFHVLIIDGSYEKYPPNCRKRGRGKPSLPESQPCNNQARKSRSTADEEPVKYPNSEPKSADVIKRRRKIKKAVENGGNCTPSSPFKSCYPHFKVEIPAKGTKELNIPDWFVKDHLSRTGNVKLQVSNGRTWTVVISFSKPPNEPPVAKFLGLTWKAFVKDNHLTEGDICRFELVKSDLFKVVLESASESTGGKSCPQTPSSLETNKSVNGNPSFTNKVLSTVDKYMYIPTWFANEHLIGSNQIKLRVSSGRTWTVSLGFSRRDRIKRSHSKLFGDYWKEFVSDINLYEGRVCMFELIKGKETLLDVSFPTSSASHHSATASGKKIHSQRLSSPNTNQDCEGLSFTKIIPPSGIRGCFVRLPTHFTKKHLAMLKEGSTIVRLAAGGKSWDVKIEIRLQPGRYANFGNGWTEFAKANGVKPGDECVFRLIRTSEVLVMKVSIKRR